ncbi:50S ribosomal protein L30 [Candidatus Woesearchaeota archaeon B3_Woes]|nr:MAG: 50S ribosomal protein L30 [Candidatus Woesearchaeota archaeon B3_Woes]
MSQKDITDIKKNLAAKKLIKGAKENIKNIKLGKISKVYISQNCPENIQNDIIKYTKIAKIDSIILNESSEELGVICKKPFSISILSFIKENKK